MKIFMIEWFDIDAGTWKQEYYMHPSRAFSRYLMLEREVPGSTPEIETQFLDVSTEPCI